MKRIIIIAVIFNLAAGIILITPAKANVPVIDPILIAAVQGGIISQATSDTISFTFEKIGKVALALALEQVKKVLINKMIQDTVTWVSGGGKPRFVTDWKGFSKDAQKQGVANFKAQARDFANTCFNTQIKIDFDLAFNDFGLGLDCSIFGIRNPNFYSDFRIGGYKAYLQGSLPSGNFYGASDEAKKQGLLAQAEADENAKKEAENGFTPNKICVTLADGQRQCRINTPGNVVAASLNTAISAPFDFITNNQASGEGAQAILTSLANALINITLQRVISNTLFP